MRDTYCSHCGTRYAAPLGYPRTCGACGIQTWANPAPVTVVLVPVVVASRTGLLVVRRAIPPMIGKVALVGGFVEEHESWQACGARELHEEANVVVDPAALRPWWFASSAPRPNYLLVFGLAPPIEAELLPPFEPNAEASERGVIFGTGDGEDALAFPLHTEAASRFFDKTPAGLQFAPV